MYSSLCKPLPCLGFEPIDAGVEYPDVEEESKVQASTEEEGGVDYYLDANITWDANEQPNWGMSEDYNTMPLFL